jgi:nucleoside-diphosphate-sugar epimerase
MFSSRVAPLEHTSGVPENVVFGAGPLGLAVARRLTSLGKSVQLVNRSGKADAPAGVQVVAADATDPAATRRVCAGAAVVFHCAVGPYGQWVRTLPPLMNGIIEGAAAAGARLVYGDNLYMYGAVDGPIREDHPYRPIGPNTRVRAEVASTLMAAHGSGKVRATIGRASDFFGAYARQSKVGDGVFGRALAGKPAQVLGNPDALHTVTFVDDFATGLVTLGQRDEALGQAWHVPSAETVTTRRFIEMVYQQIQQPVRLALVPKPMLSLLAVFIPAMRAVKETLYQSERDWVVDHSKFARAFGSQPTPHDQAIAQTVSWYRQHASSR